MKKIALYTMAAAAMMTGSIALTSCGEGFLTEEAPHSLPYDSHYYNTYDRMMEAAVAAYDPMQWFDYFGGWAPLNLVWDSMGDDIYVGGGSTSDQGEIHKISQYRSDAQATISGAWSTAYSGINRCWHLVENAQNCAALSDSEKKLFESEGKALAAWYYLVLWKTWGNVPYYEQNLTFPYLAKQLKADEIYQKVTAMLEDVLDNGPLPMNQPAEMKGRMTWAAAAMIYTDYVMYQADKAKYDKALGYMQKIISSGEYALVPAKELWDVSNEWNKEIIFDVNYCANGGKRGWGNANATGGTVLPAMIGIDGYSESKEGDKEYIAEYQGGWGFCTVSKEVYDAYEANDARRDLSILNIDKRIKDMWEKGVTVSYGGRYQNTGYFLNKYLPRPGGTEGQMGDADLNWDYNLHLYRYAETLLNAAELAMETGNNTDAQKYLDEVRQRAGVASVAVNLDNILNERRLEFVGEGKRYFDLVRTGKAATVLKAGAGVVLLQKGNEIKEGKLVEGTPVWGGTAIPERQAWNPNKKYIQIPQGEIEVTASKGEEFAIKQNPQ